MDLKGPATAATVPGYGRLVGVSVVQSSRRVVVRAAELACGFAGCTKDVKYRGLCPGHAEQRRQGKSLRPLQVRRPNRQPPRPCSYPECSKTSTCRTLCEGHYNQWRRGASLAPLKQRRPSNSAVERDQYGRKLCPSCRQWLDPSLFTAATKNVDGLAGACKWCATARVRLARYNLTPEGYTTLLAKQGGGCAICGSSDPRGYSLAVDHDHACCPDTGRSCGACIRGLLCWGCNTALGQVGDNPAVLRKAAQYLEAAGVGVEH